MVWRDQEQQRERENDRERESARDRDLPRLWRDPSQIHAAFPLVLSLMYHLWIRVMWA